MAAPRGGRDTLIYQESGVSPASDTMLNFDGADIDQAVNDLFARGMRFERYEGPDQNSNGIYRHEGPSIAWFKDPSVLEER